MGFIKYRHCLYFFVMLFISCGNSPSDSDSADQELAGWKTGVALYSFHKFSFADALQKADSAGARYVEGFSFHNLGKDFSGKAMANISAADIRTINHMLADKDMQMQSMYVGDAKDAEEWKNYFEIAKGLQMRFLVCEPPKEQWDMVDSLAGLYQIRIAIHQHAKGQSIYWHPDSVFQAVKGHSNFGACGDVGHWTRSGLDAVECLKMLEGHLLGVHIKDLDEAGNIKANDVAVGTGVIDFQAVINELKRQQFAGNVYIECEHKWENNMVDVKEAMQYLGSLSK